MSLTPSSAIPPTRPKRSTLENVFRSCFSNRNRQQLTQSRDIEMPVALVRQPPSHAEAIPTNPEQPTEIDVSLPISTRRPEIRPASPQHSTEVALVRQPVIDSAFSRIRNSGLEIPLSSQLQEKSIAVTFQLSPASPLMNGIFFLNFMTRQRHLLVPHNQELGKGIYGSVRSGEIMNEDSSVKAVAIKHNTQERHQIREIDNLRTLFETQGMMDHPYIAKTYGYISNPSFSSHLDIIFEKCTHTLRGEQKEDSKEQVASKRKRYTKIMTQIACLAQDMLDQRLRHNDFHGYNVMFNTAGDIKLIDFGFLTKASFDADKILGLTDIKHMHKRCGINDRIWEKNSTNPSSIPDDEKLISYLTDNIADKNFQFREKSLNNNPIYIIRAIATDLPENPTTKLIQKNCNTILFKEGSLFLLSKIKKFLKSHSTDELQKSIDTIFDNNKPLNFIAKKVMSDLKDFVENLDLSTNQLHGEFVKKIDEMMCKTANSLRGDLKKLTQNLLAENKRLENLSA